MSKKKNIGEGRTDNLFGLLSDPETDWAFQRTLQYAYVGAATNGECLYAASRIDVHDGETWIREWSELGERVERQAQKSLDGRHKISARTGFLRASNYYRTAEYGTPPDHPLFHVLWRKSVDSFAKASALFDPPIQRIEIEFDEERFSGGGVYLFAALLERFMGLYASLNSFSILAARSKQRRDLIREWPPRSGTKALL
jgi:hypothetical protein